MNNKKIEILSPAGSMESLVAAVEAGCDAIYLGGQNFSARSLATNFSMEELEKAIDYAHLRGVKIYITVNTLYKNTEFPNLAEFVTKTANFGADAFIVQDIGFASFIQNNFPNIPIHGSTQMTVHDIQGAIFLKEQGFKRVVLGRELSLNEIKDIVENVDIEVEVFVHGALCVCYSGQCLMSSMIGGRSGNRGSCAQPCRLKYGFYKDDELIEKGHLMSPKDLMGLEFLPEICKTGVTSLKIEGRMKKPEYVYAVTHGYREGLESIEKDKYSVPSETKSQITQVFNRGGDFTNGYFKNHSGRGMLSIETPKNTGVFIGKVRYFNPKTKSCTIEINQALHPGDGIEIWAKGNNVGTNINKEFNAPSVIEIKIDGNIEKGNPVYKSYDKKMMDNIKNSFSRAMRKMIVKCNVLAVLGKELTIEIKKDGISASMKGGIVQKAMNQPMDREKILSQIGKSGDTSLKLEFDNVDIDEGIYIGIKDINQLRRDVSEIFIEKYIASLKRDFKIPKINEIKNNVANKKKLNVSVCNKEAFLAALVSGVHGIYMEANEDFICNVEDYVSLAKAKNIKVFVALPHICKEDEYNKKLISIFEKSSIDGYLIRTWGQLNSLKVSKKIKITDYTFNVLNKYSEEFLIKKVDNITISTEINLKEINENGGEDFEVIIHGRQVLMVTNQCPIGNFAGKKCNEKFCKLKNKDGNYLLKDRMNVTFPVKSQCELCYGIILNSKILFTLNKMEDIKNLNIGFFRLSFTSERHAEIQEIIKAYLDELMSDIDGYTNENISKSIIEKYTEVGITNGHFYRGIT